MQFTNTTLGEHVGGQVYDGLPISAANPLVVDKPARDRLVINDPRSASLIRPALAPADIEAWHHRPPTRYLIAIPRGWTAATLGRDMDEAQAFAALEGRHTALAKALAPMAEALRATPHGDYWWELPPYPVDFFAAQSIIWRAEKPLVVAPSLSGAFLLAGITLTTAPSAFLLGMLGSNTMRNSIEPVLLDAKQSAQVAVVVGSETQQAQIGSYAEQLVEHAQARATLDQVLLARVLRDFAPPGSTAGPVLAEWWRLSFEAFLQELARRFKGDVPFRYRDGWQTWWNEQRLARQIQDATIARLQAELDAAVRAS